MIDTLRVEPLQLTSRCGIYAVGTDGLRCFVTDKGRVMSVEGRVLTHEDLLKVYRWGREEALEERDEEEDYRRKQPEEKL